VARCITISCLHSPLTHPTCQFSIVCTVGAWGFSVGIRTLGAHGVAVALAGLLCVKMASAESVELASLSPTEPVVVTATRTTTALDDSLPSVTVIGSEEIENRQVLSFQDLLEGEAGIQISNNGGLGKVSSVFLRGANADQVLVLVNGVRMGSATLGTTAFQYLPIDQLDRVEIVRGPLSSLYGSEAVGGVIQIFTRRPTIDGLSVGADAAAGSHDTYTVGANIGVVSGPLSYGLSASSLTSDGYPNCRGAPYVSPSSPGGGCYVYDSTPDGFHNVSGSAQMGYRFSDTADVEATVLRAQGGTRYAGDYTNHENFVEQAASVAAHWASIAALRLTAVVGQSHDNELDTLNFVEPPGSLFDTTRTSASLQADWQITSAQLLTLGSDYVRDQLSSDTLFPVTSRNITGVFGEYQAKFGSEQLALSARHDDNSQFGSETTGSLAWGHHLTQSLRLTASVGTAFHAPTLDDLYYPYFGNPDLKPETSRSFELGLEQRLADSRWSIHGFESDVHNLISYDAVVFAPENTDEARIRGIEFDGGLKAGAWSGDLTATWLDPRDRAVGSPNYNNLLPRRARGTGRLEVARTWGAFRVASRLNVAGPRFDDLANTQPLGGYTTLDALIEWTPEKHWVLQGKLGNATDRRYETALFYPQDGRNFLVTLRYRPTGS
jgi:vitamin B12 transporter